MHLLFNNEIPEVSDEHLWKRNMDIFLSIHTVTFTFDSLEQQCLAVKCKMIILSNTIHIVHGLLNLPV